MGKSTKDANCKLELFGSQILYFSIIIFKNSVQWQRVFQKWEKALKSLVNLAKLHSQFSLLIFVNFKQYFAEEKMNKLQKDSNSDLWSAC